MAHEAGKGSAQRPTNHQAFSEAFERIFETTSRQFGHLSIEDKKEECVDDEDEHDDEDEICHRCSGSGEGMFDGSCCSNCKGLGVEPVEKWNEDYE